MNPHAHACKASALPTPNHLPCAIIIFETEYYVAQGGFEPTVRQRMSLAHDPPLFTSQVPGPKAGAIASRILLDFDCNNCEFGE